MRFAKPDLYSLFSKMFWGSVVSLALIFAFFSIFVFQLQGPIIVLGFAVFLIAMMGIVSFRAQKLMLDQKTHEIHEANRVYISTVEALATAVDARDQIGRGHVNRTQHFAVRMGEELGLDKPELEALNTAALLHDIGKLAVPDHILNKPGELTPAELEKVKTHASVGASIISEIDFPYPVTPAIKHHHERWDGKGYPDGLAGDDIPLTARVLAIADAYDTLRVTRPYRPAVTREGARALLKNGSGTQFDPELVSLFLTKLREFEAEIAEKGLFYDDDDTTLLKPASREDDAGGYVEQIKKANREVFTLFELARVFGTSLNIDDTLSLFTKKISELLPMDTCVVYLLNETGSVAIAKQVEGINSEALKNRKLRVGQGTTGATLDTLQSISTAGPAEDFASYELDFVNSYKAMASVPLIAHEKLLGAVSIYSCELDSYEEEHMRLIETVSKIASDAIWTALTHAETEVRALTDPMTGLPNARSLQARFESEISRARRTGNRFQILMIDLDGFKAVNDTFGHRAGDLMLKELSDLMKAELREYDFLARYAGDEFVAIIPEADSAAALELSHRIEKSVSRFRLDIGGGRFACVGVSIGRAAYPNNGETLDQIVIAADKAMYAVKERRKRSVTDQEKERVLDIHEDSFSPEPLGKDKAEADGVRSPDAEEHDLIIELDERHVVSTSSIN
ncbi:MAG: diguanylate cyclase [Aridibacter famidurans]|nr:diguanylate cyclase [Aridibacter famidurans]